MTRFQSEAASRMSQGLVQGIYWKGFLGAEYNAIPIGGWGERGAIAKSTD